jgi:hypothetical protein
MTGCRIVQHSEIYKLDDGGKEYTLHVQTADGGKRYVIHTARLLYARVLMVLFFIYVILKNGGMLD